MAVSEIEGPRRNWRRAAQLGLSLIILGGVALSMLILGTAVPVALIGWLIVVSAIAEGIQAFRVRRSNGFLLHLIPAVAGVPIGLLIAPIRLPGPPRGCCYLRRSSRSSVCSA